MTLSHMLLPLALPQPDPACHPCPRTQNCLSAQHPRPPHCLSPFPGSAPFCAMATVPSTAPAVQGSCWDPLGPHVHPHPCLAAVLCPRATEALWVKLWPSRQAPAPHAALDGPSPASLPAHPTRGCSCSLPCHLLISHPHPLPLSLLVFRLFCFFPILLLQVSFYPQH